MITRKSVLLMASVSMLNLVGELGFSKAAHTEDFHFYLDADLSIHKASGEAIKNGILTSLNKFKEEKKCEY